MPKKRLIFTLIYKEGYFNLSRNFQLQRIGDDNWLKNNYGFHNISTSIDELVILNVSNKTHDIENFCRIVSTVTNNCFIPVALGGGIRKMNEAEKLISRGADKIMLNTILNTDRDLVKNIIKRYGSQSVIGSIDVKKENNTYKAFINNGKEEIKADLKEYVRKTLELGIGELNINSIDRDGTGQGYDLELIKYLPKNLRIPLIFSGGAGNEMHLNKGLHCREIDAVATSNLLNFIGNGLPNARKYLLNNGINVARW